MKNTIRILSLILALLMLASTFTACGKNKDEDTESSASTQNGEQAAGLPDINWEGQEYRILGRENSNDFFDNFEIYREELPEDVVGKAVYERNRKLYEDYGISVVGTLHTSHESKAKTMLESGEDLYDMIILSPEAHHPLAMAGYLVDMKTLDYVDTEAEGWQAYANEQMTMGGKLYYTTNKFLLQDKHRSWMIYYNREMARELGLGYFESMVFDGTWTLDKVNEIIKQASSDSDGQIGMTKEDTWGMATEVTYSFAQLAYGAGFRLSQKGSDGYPELVGATDRMISVLDKVYKITTDKNAYYCDETFGSIDQNDKADHVFYAERALMLEMCVSALDYLGEKIDFEFGILPNPKFDEDQTEYYSIPNLKFGSLLAVPATVVDTSFNGFALQAITTLSADTTYVQYIETKCKLQDAYDEDAAKCLDIIFNGVVYDIAFTSDISGLGTLVWRTMGAAESNNYARLYKSLEKMANKQINTIKETYAELS